MDLNNTHKILVGLPSLSGSTMSILDNVTALSIGQLHLPLRTYNALTKGNITTISGLLVALEHRFQGVTGIGASALEMITRRLQGLVDSIDEAGAVDWFSFWQSQEIKVIPNGYESGATIGQVAKQLIGIIKEILLQDQDDRDWRIIERRFDLSGTKRLTLDEIGQAFDLTRERVRQIEKKALDELRSVLLLGQYIDKNYHIHPEITAAIQLLFDSILTYFTDLIPENELFAIAERVWEINATKNRPLLILLFNLAEMSCIDFDTANIIPIWEIVPSGQRDLIVKIIRRIDGILTSENAQAMDEFDLLRHINSSLVKGQKITPIQLRKLVGLCSTVEQRNDGLYQGKFIYLKNRGDQAERLLIEAGKPLGSTEMTREINSRLVPIGAHKLTQRNLSNQLLADERFAAVGRSGTWVLRSWDYVDTASIVNLMERCLIERNSPATISEIYLYINTRRPVNQGSITMYLQQRPDLFRRIDRTQWGLSAWGDSSDAKTWGPDDVASFVANFFKQHKTKELDYSVVEKALADAANVTNKQARGMLNINPVIQTRRESYKKIDAIFQPDYRSKLMNLGARFERKKATLGEQFADDVRSILTTSPGNELSIGSLVRRLVTTHRYNRATAYAYINRMDFIEKYTVPGSRTIICRMKGKNTLNFPQIDEIDDQNVRAEIKRAIQNLTLDNVDIGLFLLGRQFEVVVKRTLLRGSQKGKITLSASLATDTSKWKLIQMVDCAKQCGLITDLGVANLLRQERNDRAHGEPPSLDERQALMNSVQYLAGLYIDYIIIFTKHAYKWT